MTYANMRWYHVRFHDILCLPSTFHHASHRWYRVHFNHILSLPATLPHASRCNLRRFRSLSCSSTLIFVVVRNSLWYQLFYFLNLLGKCLVCKFFYAQLVKGQSIWYQRKARFIKKKFNFLTLSSFFHKTLLRLQTLLVPGISVDQNSHGFTFHKNPEGSPRGEKINTVILHAWFQLSHSSIFPCSPSNSGFQFSNVVSEAIKEKERRTGKEHTFKTLEFSRQLTT